MQPRSELTHFRFGGESRNPLDIPYVFDVDVGQKGGIVATAMSDGSVRLMDVRNQGYTGITVSQEALLTGVCFQGEHTLVASTCKW